MPAQSLVASIGRRLQDGLEAAQVGVTESRHSAGEDGLSELEENPGQHLAYEREPRPIRKRLERIPEDRGAGVGAAPERVLPVRFVLNDGLSGADSHLDFFARS